ncbi:hypothetical protein OKA04_12245 [Luteolibacter flavescens]|uniref:Uncharacterized protein n=1 Tax=Luteolibacter flavescens TaxID=1859460 RepID=A0ABT3FQJ3_9BACT|nr:hypothetical protein [Luteolibacter flavescens]MCW1885501.1 hypothetical protein [Luteolibacter flavescens]
MRNYLVTFHSPDDHGIEERLSVILYKNYRVITEDRSAGLFFITDDSHSDASHILDHLTGSLDEESVFTLYVFEIRGSWDAAADEEVVQALESKIRRN